MSETKSYRWTATPQPDGTVNYAYDPPLDIPARTEVAIEHFADGSALITFTAMDPDPAPDLITRVLTRPMMAPWQIALWFVVFALVLVFLYHA